MEETACFVCSRMTRNIYYMNGVPMCSTCSAAKQTEIIPMQMNCDRCQISQVVSPGTIVLYTPYGKLCSKCRTELYRIEVPH